MLKVYKEQLTGWLQHFHRDRLLVVKSDELYLRTEETIASVQSWLGVAHADASSSKAFKRKQCARKTEDFLSVKEKYILCVWYRDKNNGLEKLIGRDGEADGFVREDGTRADGLFGRCPVPVETGADHHGPKPIMAAPVRAKVS